jgi:hypothetical protein
VFGWGRGSGATAVRALELGSVCATVLASQQMPLMAVWEGSAANVSRSCLIGSQRMGTGWVGPALGPGSVGSGRVM